MRAAVDNGCGSRRLLLAKMLSAALTSPFAGDPLPRSHCPRLAERRFVPGTILAHRFNLFRIIASIFHLSSIFFRVLNHFPCSVAETVSPLYFLLVASPPRRWRSALFCSRIRRTFSYSNLSVSRSLSVRSLCTVLFDTPKRRAAARTVALFSTIHSAIRQALRSIFARNTTHSPC